MLLVDQVLSLRGNNGIVTGAAKEFNLSRLHQVFGPLLIRFLRVCEPALAAGGSAHPRFGELGARYSPVSYNRLSFAKQSNSGTPVLSRIRMTEDKPNSTKTLSQTCSRPERVALGFCLFSTLLILAGCSEGPSSAAAPRGGERGGKLPTKDVRLATAEQKSMARKVTAPGTLAADEQASLSFKVAGRLNHLDVDLGRASR